MIPHFQMLVIYEKWNSNSKQVTLVYKSFLYTQFKHTTILTLSLPFNIQSQSSNQISISQLTTYPSTFFFCLQKTRAVFRSKNCTWAATLFCKTILQLICHTQKDPMCQVFHLLSQKGWNFRMWNKQIEVYMDWWLQPSS